VGTGQLVFGIVIVIVTAGLGVYYAWRQVQTLRRLRADRAMADDERHFQRSQAWRRLAGAVLMLVFAGLFVGMFFLEEPIMQIVQQGEENHARGETSQLNSSQKDLVREYFGYWIVLLLLVLGFIAIAGYEIFAIRRYSVRQMRRIQDERRAMIASETARLRRERNGHA
jgi:uncharacterized membrane protein YjgN (DUF898 family)